MVLLSLLTLFGLGGGGRGGRGRNVSAPVSSFDNFLICKQLENKILFWKKKFPSKVSLVAVVFRRHILSIFDFLNIFSIS